MLIILKIDSTTVKALDIATIGYCDTFDFLQQCLNNREAL